VSVVARDAKKKRRSTLFYPLQKKNPPYLGRLRRQRGERVGRTRIRRRCGRGHQGHARERVGTAAAAAAAIAAAAAAGAARPHNLAGFQHGVRGAGKGARVALLQRRFVSDGERME
jgi:hypothetical protein